MNRYDIIVKVFKTCKSLKYLIVASEEETFMQNGDLEEVELFLPLKIGPAGGENNIDVRLVVDEAVKADEKGVVKREIGRWQ